MRVRQSIEAKLRETLDPQHLEVIDETHMHNVAPDGESHFRVVVVAAAFEGQSSLQRHRRIYELLGDEMAGGIHALGIQTLTPAEAQGDSRLRVESPPCLGGNS